MRRTILATLVALALALVISQVQATDAFPTAVLDVKAKRQSANLIGGMLRTLEDDQTGACITQGAAPKRFPRAVKVASKRFAMIVRVSRADSPKSVELRRQRRSIPPPPGLGIDGKVLPTTVMPVIEGGATTAQRISFKAKVRGHTYLQLRLTWPDPCDDDKDEYVTFGFHLRGK